MSAGLKTLVARARGFETVAPSVVHMDTAGDPDAPCAGCGGQNFHREPNAAWRCSTCLPPILPDCASKLTGWAFCSVPAP